MQFRSTHVKPGIDLVFNSNRQNAFDAGTLILLKFMDTEHELVKLGDSIEWKIFEECWRKKFSDTGRHMASSGRRVAGMLMIQHMGNLLDEGLVVQ